MLSMAWFWVVVGMLSIIIIFLGTYVITREKVIDELTNELIISMRKISELEDKIRVLSKSYEQTVNEQREGINPFLIDTSKWFENDKETILEIKNEIKEL